LIRARPEDAFARLDVAATSEALRREARGSLEDRHGICPFLFAGSSGWRAGQDSNLRPED
jgi:hypothetical protein